MTEQVATAPVPARVQAVNVPVPDDVRVTVPVGVIAVPPEVSVTVTVHVVAWLTTTVVGAQEIVVVVVLRVTVRANVPLLALWLVSPA